VTLRWQRRNIDANSTVTRCTAMQQSASIPDRLFRLSR
jgi:hypothetical protein